MENKLTPGSNMMWESSRMMLPEHVSALLQQKEDSKKVSKPEIDEQALMEISIVVMDSLHNEADIQITVWKDGYFHDHVGVVSRVDYQMKYIRLEQVNDEFERIMINDITGAKIL